MEISSNIKTFGIFLISDIGSKKRPAYQILYFPEEGGCIRNTKFTEENAKIFIAPDVPMPYLCEVLNEHNNWEYQLYIPKDVSIKIIPNFDEEAERIIRIYPDGMAFPDMFPGGIPYYEWTDDVQE